MRQEFRHTGIDMPYQDIEEVHKQYVTEPPVRITYLELQGQSKVDIWKPTAQCSIRVSAGLTVDDSIEGARLLAQSRSHPHIYRMVMLSFFGDPSVEDERLFGKRFDEAERLGN